MNPPDPPLPPGADERWTVLHTRSRREKQVARICTFFGVRHYLPLREHWTGTSRRRLYAVPIFPSYVFAYLTSRTRVEILRTGLSRKYSRHRPSGSGAIRGARWTAAPRHCLSTPSLDS